jgi:hypothetical protein
MRLRATSPLLHGWEGEASLSTGHTAWKSGGAVLLVEGEPVGTAEATLAGYEVLEATPEELEALKAAGYLPSPPQTAQEARSPPAP